MWQWRVDKRLRDRRPQICDVLCDERFQTREWGNLVRSLFSFQLGTAVLFIHGFGSPIAYRNIYKRQGLECQGPGSSSLLEKLNSAAPLKHLFCFHLEAASWNRLPSPGCRATVALRVYFILLFLPKLGLQSYNKCSKYNKVNTTPQQSKNTAACIFNISIPFCH